MTSPCLTLHSADAFSDSTFRAEVGTCPYFFFPLPQTSFLLRSPSHSLAVCKLPILPTPPCGSFSAHLHSCPFCPLSIGTFRADASSLFLGFLSRLYAPGSPRPPPALAFLAPPPASPRRLDPSIPCPRLRAGALCPCADDPAANAERAE